MEKTPPSLKIRLGKVFEASASGVFAIVALLVAVLAVLLSRGFGIW